MTRRQRRIIVILAIADLAVILGIALLIYLAHGITTALPTPYPHTESPTSGGPADSAGTTCQWQAAQQMVQAGLSGSVTLIPGGALHFEIATTLAPGQTPDDAAQLVWIAFDVALALKEACDFTRVEVTVRIQDSPTTLHVAVAAADLTAYGTGALTEDEFITRVTYTVDHR